MLLLLMMTLLVDKINSGKLLYNHFHIAINFNISRIYSCHWVLNLNSVPNWPEVFRGLPGRVVGLADRGREVGGRKRYGNNV